MSILLAAAVGGLVGILVWFLWAILIIAVIAGLIWLIERWVSPIPNEVKLVIAIILIIVVVILALQHFGAM
jgi:L-asparagine transporter-like permease